VVDLKYVVGTVVLLGGV